LFRLIKRVLREGGREGGRKGGREGDPGKTKERRMTSQKG
jgi:hypothetical protein